MLGGIFLLSGLSWAGDGKILRFIYCSDVHYGLEREFRGSSAVAADSVSRAMLASFRILEQTALPDDGGVAAGEIFGAPDFVVCTGDIANRMEKGVQTASASWEQFCRDWADYSGRLYLVPGNHDISNAIGYPKPLHPEKDASSAAGIYNLMMKPDTALAAGEFDYSIHLTHFSFVMDSIRFVFMGMWPDGRMRSWFMEETSDDDGMPVLLFTHDPPEADAKHFTNPNGRHDINPVDRFENLLSDTCSIRKIDQEPLDNWRRLEAFLRNNGNIKAWFHGDWNFNEFYDWSGVEGTVSLPVFRVDSPMKGDYSSEDETLLSYIAVTVDAQAGILTARECLWNESRAPGITWGEERTIQF